MNTHTHTQLHLSLYSGVIQIYDHNNDDDDNDCAVGQSVVLSDNHTTKSSTVVQSMTTLDINDDDDDGSHYHYCGETKDDNQDCGFNTDKGRLEVDLGSSIE